MFHASLESSPLPVPTVQIRARMRFRPMGAAPDPFVTRVGASSRKPGLPTHALSGLQSSLGRNVAVRAWQPRQWHPSREGILVQPPCPCWCSTLTESPSARSRKPIKTPHRALPKPQARAQTELTNTPRTSENRELSATRIMDPALRGFVVRCASGFLRSWFPALRRLLPTPLQASRPVLRDALPLGTAIDECS